MLYIVYCILYIVYCMIYIVYCIPDILYCIPCIVYGIEHTVYSIMNIVYCNVSCISYTVCCVRHTVCCTLCAALCVKPRMSWGPEHFCYVTEHMFCVIRAVCIVYTPCLMGANVCLMSHASVVYILRIMHCGCVELAVCSTYVSFIHVGIETQLHTILHWRFMWDIIVWVCWNATQARLLSPNHWNRIHRLKAFACAIIKLGMQASSCVVFQYHLVHVMEHNVCKRTFVGFEWLYVSWRPSSNHLHTICPCTWFCFWRLLVYVVTPEIYPWLLSWLLRYIDDSSTDSCDMLMTIEVTPEIYRWLLRGFLQ